MRHRHAYPAAPVQPSRRARAVRWMRPARSARLEAPAELLARRRSGVAEERIEPFDWMAAQSITASASSTVTLLGPTTTPSVQRVPFGARAVVDDIVPVLQGPCGPIDYFSILGATYRWDVTVDGQPAPRPWDSLSASPRWLALQPSQPLFEMGESAQLMVTLTFADEVGFYRFAGVRVRGRFIFRRHSK